MKEYLLGPAYRRQASHEGKRVRILHGRVFRCIREAKRLRLLHGMPLHPLSQIWVTLQILQMKRECRYHLCDKPIIVSKLRLPIIINHKTHPNEPQNRQLMMEWIKNQI